MSDHIHDLALLKLKSESGIAELSNEEFMEKYLKTCKELEAAECTFRKKYPPRVI